MATTLQPVPPTMQRQATPPPTASTSNSATKRETQALIDLILSGLSELRQIPNLKRLRGHARARAQTTINSIFFGLSELRNLTTNPER